MLTDGRTVIVCMYIHIVQEALKYLCFMFICYIKDNKNEAVFDSYATL